MNPKRRMNETQIEKKTQREANGIDQFQQRKRNEELTNGMALRNAALEQLDHTICAEQKQQYPSCTLCYSVPLTLQVPQAVKLEKVETHDVRDSHAKPMCTVIRREGAARADNAARQRSAKAVP